jgi:hypothetical protein
VIPGADVKIQNTGTGETVNVVTAVDGGFNAVALNARCRRVEPAQRWSQPPFFANFSAWRLV